MIYEHLKKHKFDFEIKYERDGFSHKTILNEKYFWIYKAHKKFTHKHYKELFDDIFSGYFYKFVATTEDGHDYRINLHCQGTTCRYLVTYIAHEVLVVYNFKTPDKIKILGTECSLEKPSDVLFNFEMQYPLIMKDVNEIIREIQKKHP